MKINLNTQGNVNLILFPDNQPHVKIDPTSNNGMIDVVCSITDSKKLLELCMLKDAIDRLPGQSRFKWLRIPYLMGARFDRVMNPGDSFDLKVIAKIINSLNFDKVTLYDPHSDVASALIDRSSIVNNNFMVQSYKKEDAVLIIPDGGAEKKAANYPMLDQNLKHIVHCIKHRDTSNGEVTSVEVLNAKVCTGKNCVIIDDICDGGRTFIEIAKILQAYKPSHLTLIVTHGIFSKGFMELEEYFDEIIVSDSYARTYNSKIVKLVPIF